MGTLRRIIKRIRELLAPQRSAEGNLSTDLCDHVDTSEVADALHIIEKAKHDAECNIPHPLDTNLSATERLIEQYVQSLTTRTNNDAISRLQSIEGDIKQRTGRAKAALSFLETVESRVEAEFKTLRGRQNQKEERFRNFATKSAAALQEFKRMHNIERDAEIRESHLPVIAAATFAFVFEAIVNALFFQQGLYGGYVQGVLMASAIAAVDVAFLFLVGLNAVKVQAPRSMPIQRAIGVFCCLVVASWTLSYNLLAAHVREHFQGDLDWNEVSTAALASFVGQPFGLTQIDSWVLFVACMLFSGLAAATGWKWDERIPGYKKATKRFRFAKDDLEAVIDKGRNDADRVRNELIDKVVSERDTAEKSLARLTYLVGLKAKLEAQLGTCTQYHDGLLRALIQQYRSENAAARTTPPPGYFNEMPITPPVSMPVTISSIDSNQSELKRIRRRVDKVVAVWATVGMKVAEHHQEYLTNSSSSIDDDSE